MLLCLVLAGAGCGRERPTAVTDSEAVQLADSQWSRGDVEQARRTLSGVLEKKADSFPALYRRGALSLWDDAPGAIRDLDAAARLAPDHPGPVFFHGMALVLSRDVEGGRVRIEEAIRLAGARSGWALAETSEAARAGLEALRSGYLGEARASFARAVAADTTDASLWMLLGTASIRSGDTRLALNAADHALGLRRNLPAAHALRGLAFHGLERYPEARAELDLARAGKPLPPDVHYLAGLLEVQASNYRDSARSLWLAVLEDPTVAVYHKALGDVLIRMSLGDLGSRYLQLAEILQSATVGRVGR